MHYSTNSLLKKLTIALSVCTVFILASAARAEHLADFHQAQNIECDVCHTQNTETPPKSDTCLMCHDDYFDKTIDAWPNPHANPHIQPTDEVVCTDCHKGHSQQTVTCQTCHENFKFNVK